MASSLFNDFPELSHLSREDLEDLLADPTYFQAIFHSLQSVKDLYQNQADLGLANETIARNNLAMQDDLYKLRAETKDAFDESKALEAQWKDLDRQQRELSQRFTPAFLLMRLRHATTAQDDASEACASAYVQGSSNSGADSAAPVDAFVREFKEMRKVYHKRVMWGERWQAGEVTWPED